MKKIKCLHNQHFFISIFFTYTLIFGHLAAYAASSGSISVSAICGKGCMPPDAQSEVYLLRDTEFDEYIKNSEKASLQPDELKSSGKTPALISKLPPGSYYVGVEAKLDMSVIPQPGFNETIVAKISDFFADDLSVAKTHRLFVEKGQAIFAFRKWYYTSVKNGLISKVTALFLTRNAKVSDWSIFYPKKEQFKINMSEELFHSFWEKLNDIGGNTSPSEQISFTSLLKRGGKVCIPNSSNPMIVWINEKGQLQATSRIRLEGGLKDAGMIAPNYRVTSTLPSDTGSENKSSSLFPPYTEYLEGRNEVRIVNPNPFSTEVGLRFGNKGSNFKIPPQGRQSVFVPDGKYEIFFIYSNEPDSLYKGEAFSLHSNGIEIQIVKVIGGNYSIQKVK